jgi:hypothetical protein
MVILPNYVLPKSAPAPLCHGWRQRRRQRQQSEVSDGAILDERSFLFLSFFSYQQQIGRSFQKQFLWLEATLWQWQ